MTKSDPSFAHLREIHLKWIRLYTRILGQVSLTLPKYSLLSQLVRYGKMPMTEASEKLYISKPALTNLVKRMEKESLLKKTAHPKDHRSFLIRVLPKGKKTVLRAQNDILKFILATLNSLPENEKTIVDNFFIHLSGFMDGALSQAKGSKKK